MSQLASILPLSNWSESDKAVLKPQRVPLTQAHHDSLDQIPGATWKPTEHLAHVHTVNVASVYPGFKTNSEGTDLGTSNAFLSPTKNGWRVVRYGTTTKEHDSWLHSEESTITYIKFPSGDVSKETMRRVHKQDGTCKGWVYITDNGLVLNKSASGMRLILKSDGESPSRADTLLGEMEKHPFIEINLPLSPEYPDTAQREWNRFGIKFKVEAKQGEHPTWDAMYKHLGKSLDVFLKTPPIESLPDGATYLKLFHALSLRTPTQRLPYLAFVGSQNSGKTTFLACTRHLVTNSPTQAVVSANHAITSTGNFNGEFEGALFGAVEEIRVTHDQFQRVKDWVTGFEMPIHSKGFTPFKVPNTMHLVQTCNDISFVPLQMGDSRITVLEVDELKERIPADEFDRRLASEAPAMLRTLLNMPLPESHDRLWLPVLQTEHKTILQEMGRSDIDEFFATCVAKTNSKTTIKLKEFISIVGRNIPTIATRQNVVKAILDAGGKVKPGRSREKYVHNLIINEPEV